MPKEKLLEISINCKDRKHCGDCRYLGFQEDFSRSGILTDYQVDELMRINWGSIGFLTRRYKRHNGEQCKYLIYRNPEGKKPKEAIYNFNESYQCLLFPNRHERFTRKKVVRDLMTGLEFDEEGALRCLDCRKSTRINKRKK